MPNNETATKQDIVDLLSLIKTQNQIVKLVREQLKTTNDMVKNLQLQINLIDIKNGGSLGRSIK